MTGIALTGSAWLAEALLFQGELRLPQGWTCLLGPSGAGKSTVLRLLARLPTGARFDGRIEAPDRVAYMAQDDLLQPRLSLVDNVLIGQRLRGGPVDADRARALLASVGLAGLERRRPGSLSGGQRQRVALARALMEDGPLALLDEPFSALDAATRRRVQDLARDRLAGRAVLLVTHDPFEALRLGERMVLLAEGRLRPVPVPDGAVPREPDSPGFAGAYRDLMALLTETA